MTNVEELQPVEYNVVIELDRAEERTAGGIILTTEKVDRNRLEETAGTLVSLSPLAFNYDDWPESARKPQIGDRVHFARYAGILSECAENRWVRIIKDREIVAVVAQQPKLAAAAQAFPIAG